MKVKSHTNLMVKPSYPEVDKCFEIPVHFVFDGVNQGVHRGIKTWGHLERIQQSKQEKFTSTLFARAYLSIPRNQGEGGGD